jgi:DNA-binding XRE family transcriptional regulator
MLNKGLGSLTTKEINRIKSSIEVISSQVQTARKNKGYTQEKLAEILDVNANTIKYIEQGRRIPSLPMLLRICWELDIEIKVG